MTALLVAALLAIAWTVVFGLLWLRRQKARHEAEKQRDDQWDRIHLPPGSGP